MAGSEEQGGELSSSSPSSSRTPRLAFPIARSRPTSIVDTTIEATPETILSTSPASSITSTGASSQKHSQSAADRLASAQAKDAAASKSHRVRTTSSTSRSSTESARPKLPSLLQATKSRSAATPAASTSVELSSDDKPQDGSRRPATGFAAGDAAGAVEPARGQPMVRCRSGDQASTTNAKVAGPSTVKKPTAAPKRLPNAPPLVALLSDSSTSKLIKQGAEAKVYISRIESNNILSWPQPHPKGLASRKVEAPASILLKWRFPKTYRHPTLSSNITASRTIMEARALLRCAKAGVAVPAVRCVDEKEGILGLELIAGKSVREWLGGGAEGEDELVVEEHEANAAQNEEVVLSENDQIKLMRLIGKQLAIMHEADIIHGDLTTSNMMLRPAFTPSPQESPVIVDLDRDEVVLIDFGLSSVSAFAEDKAVDLYVLERAFASTHPASEGLFQTILDCYAEEVTARSSGKNRGKGGKLGKWEETRRKLEEVRLRGRKRSMVGSALWKETWNRRVVLNVELSLQFHCHGIISTIRSLPTLASALLSLRPNDVLRLLPLSESGPRMEQNEWHSLASRMDTELDHIGSARLLASHTLHESCVRMAPVQGKPVWTVPLVPFQSRGLTGVPFVRPMEWVVDTALTKALKLADRVVPASVETEARLGLRGKDKTD